jgi:hypothetical protein
MNRLDRLLAIAIALESVACSAAGVGHESNYFRSGDMHQAKLSIRNVDKKTIEFTISQLKSPPETFSGTALNSNVGMDPEQGFNQNGDAIPLDVYIYKDHACSLRIGIGMGPTYDSYLNVTQCQCQVIKSFCESADQAVFLKKSAP